MLKGDYSNTMSQIGAQSHPQPTSGGYHVGWGETNFKTLFEWIRPCYIHCISYINALNLPLHTEFCIQRFVNYLEFLKHVIKCCQGCTFKQLLEATNYAHKYPALDFVRVSTDHAHFSNHDIHILCEPNRPTLLLFSCRIPEKKPDSMSVASRPTCFLAWKRSPPLSQAYQCRSLFRIFGPKFLANKLHLPLTNLLR